MMSRMVGSLALAWMLAVSVTVMAGDASAGKCPVSGAAAKASVSADYKGGTVHFCCENCAAKFAADPSKYASKANEQLVATGQAKQKACPFSGGKCNPATKLAVDGVNVCFCCNGCKGKVAKADASKQVEMVFSDDAFAKGFKVGK